MTLSNLRILMRTIVKRRKEIEIYLIQKQKIRKVNNIQQM